MAATIDATTVLSSFPITSRWPPRHPDRLQLYSSPSPNGVKASIMLEEVGLPYEAHFVDFRANDQGSAEFRALNPNAKVPAIIDPDGPGGRPLALFESAAILLYLADKTGQLVPTDTHARYELLQWLFWQMSGPGPMFFQVGWYRKFAGRKVEDKRPLEHYAAESARLLRVLDQRLEGRTWVMGEAYTIADIAFIGGVRNLIGFYDAADLVGFGDLANVPRWLDQCLGRPAVQRGLAIPAAAPA